MWGLKDQINAIAKNHKVRANIGKDISLVGPKEGVQEARDHIQLLLTTLMKDFITRFYDNREMIEILFRIKEDDGLRKQFNVKMQYEKGS